MDTKNYTLQYYWDELCDKNTTQFLKWYIATNDLAMLVIFHNKIVYWMFPLPFFSMHCMASMSQVWMLKVSIVIHLIWIYRFCWFYWFQCFDLITLRCCSYLSKQQVWWNDTTTDDICTYFNDEFIVILSNIIFTNCACDSCKVGDYPVGLTADPANLIVQSRGRTEYRTAVLTARPIEATRHT